MAVLTGHQLLLKDLNAYARALDQRTLENVVESGAEIIVEAVRDQVNPSRTGTLKQSITSQAIKGFGGQDTMGVDIGWARMKRPRGSRSSYTHVYGPILEYSDTRKLRHMLEGYELSSVRATEAMLHIVYRKMGERL